MKFVNLGFNNMILDSRIVAIVSPDSAPAKRIVSEAKENSRIIDCTGGRRTKCVILLTPITLFCVHFPARRLQAD